MCAKLDRQQNGEILWAQNSLILAHLLSDIPLLRARLAVLQDRPATQILSAGFGWQGEEMDGRIWMGLSGEDLDLGESGWRGFGWI